MGNRREDDRYYRAFWDAELLLPSVTTIIGSVSSKGGLPNWYAIEAARYAVDNHDEMSALVYDRQESRAIALAAGAPRRIADEAADLGKLFHKVADAQIRGQVLALTEEEKKAVAPFMATLEQFIEETKPTYRWTEATVYHRRLLYAGTADCGIEFGIPLPVVVRRKLAHTFPPGTLLVGDYKSGKNVYDETVMQLTGYGDCTHMDLRNETHTIVEMPKVAGGVVIHIRPDGYRMYPVMFTPQIRAGWAHARRWFEVQRHQMPESIGMGVRAGGFRVDDFTGLDVRVRNKLAQEGIFTLAELEKFGREEFLGIKHAGPAGVRIAREILAIEDREWPLGPDEIAKDKTERGVA